VITNLFRYAESYTLTAFDTSPAVSYLVWL
jgi:hypothetical protein